MWYGRRGHGRAILKTKIAFFIRIAANVVREDERKNGTGEHNALVRCFHHIPRFQHIGAAFYLPKVQTGLDHLHAQRSYPPLEQLLADRSAQLIVQPEGCGRCGPLQQNMELITRRVGEYRNADAKARIPGRGDYQRGVAGIGHEMQLGRRIRVTAQSVGPTFIQPVIGGDKVGVSDAGNDRTAPVKKRNGQARCITFSTVPPTVI